MLLHLLRLVDLYFPLAKQIANLLKSLFLFYYNLGFFGGGGGQFFC